MNLRLTSLHHPLQLSLFDLRRPSPKNLHRKRVSRLRNINLQPRPHPRMSHSHQIHLFRSRTRVKKRWLMHYLGATRMRRSKTLILGLGEARACGRLQCHRPLLNLPKSRTDICPLKRLARIATRYWLKRSSDARWLLLQRSKILLLRASMRLPRMDVRQGRSLIRNRFRVLNWYLPLLA